MMVYQITVRIKRGLGVSVVCPQIFESFGEESEIWTHARNAERFRKNRDFLCLSQK